MSDLTWIALGVIVAFMVLGVVVFTRNSSGEAEGELTKNKAKFRAKSAQQGDNKALVTRVNLDSSTDTHVSAKGAGSEASDVSAKGAQGARVKAEKD